MNIMVFLRASRDRSGEDFKTWYVEKFAAAIASRYPDLRRHLVNVSEEGPEELRLPHDSRDPEAHYDVVAQMSWNGEGARTALPAIQADLLPWADVQHVYRVSESVILDKEPHRADPLPGYKLLRELLFFRDLPDAAARRCWSHHAKLALKVHIGMTRYVQHWVEERLSLDTPVVRGISELYFPTREELVLRYYESPRGREEIIHDTAHFIEQRLPRVYSREAALRR